MNRNNFTSESVTCGHPDKICDQIADRILDALLEQDPQSRVACEVTCTTDAVHIFGEVTTKAEVDYAGLARRVIEEIGYTEPNRGFDAETCRIKVDLHEQSPDIARGIARRNEAERINTAPEIRAFCLAMPVRKPSTGCRCPSSWPTRWRSGWSWCAAAMNCNIFSPTGNAGHGGIRRAGPALPGGGGHRVQPAPGRR